MNPRKAFAVAFSIAVVLLAMAGPALAQGAGGRAENSAFAVVVGGSRIMRVSDVTRVAVAEPAIADVVVASKTEVIVIGKSEGKTTLHVWDSSGRSSFDVQVCLDNEGLLREIEEAIGESGVRARFARTTLVLEGAVETEAESRRVELIAGAYADRVVSLLEVKNPTTPPPPPVVDPAEVQAAIAIDGVSVRALKDTIVLEGAISDPLDSERAEKIASVFSSKVLNLITIIDPPAVEVITGSQRASVTVSGSGEATGP